MDDLTIFRESFDKHGKVCIFLPVLNEEYSIEYMIRSFQQHGFLNIVVIDGNSSDKTREISIKNNTDVITQSGKGKGNAIIEGFSYILSEYPECEYIAMVDGDGTYDPDDIFRLLYPVINDDYDHVIGNRLAHPSENAFTGLNKFGNKILNIGFRLFHGVGYKDILSGYRVFTKQSIEKINLSRNGFEIETEISVQHLYRNLKTNVIPVSYYPRPSGSSTNLSPLIDGFKIGYTIFNTSSYNNPFSYYTSIGLLLSIIGTCLGICISMGMISHPNIESFLSFATIMIYMWSVLLITFGFVMKFLYKKIGEGYIGS
jgi:dolichol-phosphate mannosyltransferase